MMETSTTINTNQFGEINVKADNVITFVQPILGFDEFRRFVLIEDKDFFPIQWLQSVKDSGLAFPIINPDLLNIKYNIDPVSFLLESLKLGNINDAVIYTLLVIPSNRIEEVRTNLKAPLIINSTKRLATQVVYEDPGYPVQYYLFKGQNINVFSRDETLVSKS